jgi:hypothetical protein
LYPHQRITQALDGRPHHFGDAIGQLHRCVSLSGVCDAMGAPNKKGEP